MECAASSPHASYVGLQRHLGAGRVAIASWKSYPTILSFQVVLGGIFMVSSEEVATQVFAVAAIAIAAINIGGGFMVGLPSAIDMVDTEIIFIFFR